MSYAVVVAVLGCRLLLAIAVATASGSGDLDALAAAAGHPARTHWRASATFTSEGRSGTLTVDQAGTKRLLRRCIADVCSGVWFDGTRSYTFGVNDALFHRVSDDAETRTRAAIASRAFAEPEFITGGGSAHVLRHDGSRTVWQIQARDGAPLEVTVEGGSILAITRPDGAALAPLDEALSARNAQPVEGPLEAPAGGSPTLGPSVDLPLGNGPLPIVPCSIGTRNLRCLIDTGTTPSAMTLALAEELQLEPHGEIEIAGFGRSHYATGIVDAGPLVVGNATFAAWHFAVIPGARGFGFDIILGSDAFASIRLSIDGVRRRVHISASRADDGVRGWPLTFPGGLPRTNVALGEHELSALLDTGDSALLSIDYETLRHETSFVHVSASGTSSGIGGTSDALEALAHVRVSGTEFPSARVTVSRTQREAHLGSGVLKQCMLVLDFAQSRAECASP